MNVTDNTLQALLQDDGRIKASACWLLIMNVTDNTLQALLQDDGRIKASACWLLIMNVTDNTLQALLQDDGRIKASACWLLIMNVTDNTLQALLQDDGRIKALALFVIFMSNIVSVCLYLWHEVCMMNRCCKIVFAGHGFFTWSGPGSYKKTCNSSSGFRRTAGRDRSVCGVCVCVHLSALLKVQLLLTFGNDFCLGFR